ncbi:tetratricopeptide repeat protein [Methylophilus aquaticus]|uniref:Tetratricopeptide repeat protein n=1 Tax=Methylophilus aquaticus TaxID=1971610 RepID=A0ABT9JSB4_9PROT|nr:tetratricopeptide repeat protein [Methylophilus aquaticus]MDP8567481.1 tetratricopeptide repeat protein [Methylophilus aquaticus]
MAKTLPQEINGLIQLLSLGQFANVVQRARLLLAQHPREFVLHHVLALALDQSQQYPQAAQAYHRALQLQATSPELWFNYAIVLTHLGQWQEAEQAYRKSISLNPRFFEAHGNLGTLLQKQGKLDEAIASYRTGLTIQPQDPRGHFNLGTALRDKGLLADAVSSYEQAITLFPNYTDAYNNLGETCRDQGDMSQAVHYYQQALQRNPQHANANYNMGEFLYLAKRFEEAIPYFETSQLDDWQARVLYCLYRAEQFEAFKQLRDTIAKQGAHTAPFIATLSTHYSINHGEADPYQFCPNGLDFVYQRSIPELAPGTALLEELLNNIAQTDIAERKQARLTNGKQSAGNLFKRSEPAFRALGELVKREFSNYRTHFNAANCALISHFPEALDFTSSWYVRMHKGGHLDAHIHEIGWISGAVYLAMPETVDPKEGAFEYGTHGDQYPQLHTDFPTAFIKPKVGDIVLFPSSLFHRTIPFDADAERICVAFDLKPSPNLATSHSQY